MKDGITAEAQELAKILWNYQRLNMPLKPADVVIAMGCEDGRVAERAAHLYKDGYSQWIVCTGRAGERTKKMLEDKGFASEAAYFADIAQKAGVPSDRILQEDRATHSVENVTYTKELFVRHNIVADHIIVVAPPYSERRQQATYAANWPGQSFSVTSPHLTFDTYPTAALSQVYLINALVGRVQRMKVYGDRGFQAKTKIPKRVWKACERLIDLGYTEQLA